MSDFIDRQAAIDAMWKALYDYEDKTEKQFQESDELDVAEWIVHRMFVQNMNDIDRRVISDLPSADVAPVRHGRWVYGENEGQDGWYCSECHFFIPWYYDWYGLDNIDFIKDFHACPHCSAKMVTYTGAKMDGGEDGPDSKA